MNEAELARRFAEWCADAGDTEFTKDGDRDQFVARVAESVVGLGYGILGQHACEDDLTVIARHIHGIDGEHSFENDYPRWEAFNLEAITMGVIDMHDVLDHDGPCVITHVTLGVQHLGDEATGILNMLRAVRDQMYPYPTVLVKAYNAWA